MTHFRLRYRKAGGHVHVRFFSAMREGLTHGKNGALTFREEEWESFLRLFQDHGGIDSCIVLPDDGDAPNNKARDIMPGTICRNPVRISPGRAHDVIEYDVPVRFLRDEACHDVTVGGLSRLGGRRRWIYETIGIVPSETFYLYEPLAAWFAE